MRKLGIAFVALGLLMALAAGLWTLYNAMEERQAGEAARNAMERVASAIGGGIREEPGQGLQPEGADAPLQEQTAPQPEPMATLTLDGHTYIGYVAVPEVGVELPVQSEGELKLLKHSPGRYQGTLAEGNLILLGHNYKDHFGPLALVTVGGRVVFTDVLGNVYEYVVTQIQTVKGKDSPTMIAGSDQWDLTLFTCNKGGETRLALRCVLEGKSF